MRAAGEWGVRFFKFDFAEFGAAPKGTAESPEVLYLTGFARGGFDGPMPLGATIPPAVDRSLLGVVDRVFSADPHAFDVPRTDLTRNVDLHQDRQVWHLHQAGFPLHRIEDHGAVMAATNTGHHRGRAGFVRTHVAQLARGGRRDLFYGDPRLLTEADVRAMGRMRALFFDAWRRGLETVFLGPGEPGRGGWHGWMTGGGQRGLVYLVNITDYPVRVRLPVVSVMEGRALFWDGAEAPAVQGQHDLLQVELPAESAVLVGLGEYAASTWGEAVVTNDPPGIAGGRLLEATWRYEGEAMRATVQGVRRGERLRVTVEVDAAGPGGVAAGPLRIGPQETKTDDAMKALQTHRLVGIRVMQGGGELVAVRRVPDVPVWSGIAWVMAEYDVAGDVEVVIDSALEPRRKLTATATAVR